MSEFLHMGGYAFYVWTSYGLAFAILVFNLLVPWRRERHLRRGLGRPEQPREGLENI